MMSLGVILLAAACGLAGFRVLTGFLAQERSADVMETLRSIVPQYDNDAAEATGRGEDPLPMVEIDGTSFVGYIEAPDHDIEVPVAGTDHEGTKFAFQESGSPVRGRFVVAGRDVKGALASIDELKPGERVTFVDVNGVRYTYKITGMGSVKEIEDIDHDLVIHRGVSRNISFAVFGTME